MLPVLEYTDGAGETQYMAESKDIINMMVLRNPGAVVRQDLA